MILIGIIKENDPRMKAVKKQVDEITNGLDNLSNELETFSEKLNDALSLD